jgi:hypothetical protein
MKTRTQVAELLARKQLLDTQAHADVRHNERLRELRTWQAERLSRTYADLHADPHYTQAIEFFLRDVYGPQEFAQRDRDLGRAWHYLNRALPRAACDLLARAIELHVLTAELDQALSEALPAGPVSAQTYETAYRIVNRRGARAHQIDLVVAIGQDLTRLVRRPWVALALRAAHTPAHAAGLGALQDFLERGFAAFRHMSDPQALLQAVRERETRLMDALLNQRPLPGSEALAAKSSND